MLVSVSMLRLVLFILCVVLIECTTSVRADDQGCYTSGSVAGIVIATVVVTLVMGGLAVAFIWYLWKQRKAGFGDNKSIEKPIMCPPMSPDKQMIARESNDYAFDNPYFKDDETENTNLDSAEKGESGFRKDNGDVTPAQNAKASNGTAGINHKKSRPFSSLPFHAVFHPSGKKPQKTTMDDTYISKHLERITVPLRGHDFTGLGFNICGNMRDGIFVKDVLHRGPASESGKIKAGDRIVGVTVSFAAMVYEDALTILSYASPYDVRLEIEKTPATLSGTHLPSSSPKRLGTSTSFRNNGQRQLFHPLYRSQSIDDLTKIGKDGFGVINTSGSQRDSSASATPKRSQSVEASNGGPKTRTNFVLKSDESKSNKGSRKSSTSSCESTAKAVTPTEISQSVFNEEPCIKKEVKSARFRTEQVNVKTEAASKVIPPLKPARESQDEKQLAATDVPDKSSEVLLKSSSDIPVDEVLKPDASPAETQAALDGELDVTEKPTAPPRKSSAPKRRAPAPPPVPAAKTETSAVVHRAEELQQELVAKDTEIPSEENSAFPPPPPYVSDFPSVTDETQQVADETLPVAIEILPIADENLTKETTPVANGSFEVSRDMQLMENDLPVFSSTEKLADPGIGSSDTSSLASGDHSTTKLNKDDQNASPGKRKASSLGDLTKLEQDASKKSSTSSAILERAVSLDLQQSIPGENLTKQKKILRAPAFEDDYLEDREDLMEINGQGLKRWDTDSGVAFDIGSSDCRATIVTPSDGLDKVFPKLANGETTLSDELSNEEENPSAESNAKVEISSSNAEKLDVEVVTDSSAEKPASDLENDSPAGELPLPNSTDSSILLTSTPIKRIIEVKNLPIDDEDKDDGDKIDDVPYLASAKQLKQDESTSKHTAKNNSSSPTTLFSPVTISIPVIKPDLTQFEKLPSPPPASTHPGFEPSWRMTKTITTTDDSGKTSLERISVQSLYKPIFTSKEINNIDEPGLQTSVEKMVNGNDSDASEHYSTAQENDTTSSVETSSFSLTLSTPVTKEVTKTPNTIAGFAKTLIIPGPNEVENLLSLADEPNTPPPALEHPAMPIESE